MMRYYSTLAFILLSGCAYTSNVSTPLNDDKTYNNQNGFSSSTSIHQNPVNTWQLINISSTPFALQAPQGTEVSHVNDRTIVSNWTDMNFLEKEGEFRFEISKVKNPDTENYFSTICKGMNMYFAKQQDGSFQKMSEYEKISEWHNNDIQFINFVRNCSDPNNVQMIEDRPSPRQTYSNERILIEYDNNIFQIQFPTENDIESAKKVIETFQINSSALRR